MTTQFVGWCGYDVIDSEDSDEDKQGLSRIMFNYVQPKASCQCAPTGGEWPVIELVSSELVAIN